MKLFEIALNFNEKQPRWVDDVLMRGGRPLNKDAIKQLKHHGIKTVICFLKPNREYPAEIRGVADEKAALEAEGIDFYNIPMSEQTGPSEADIEEFLRIMKKGGAIYAHCSAGRDRVGLMTAIYDVVIRGRSFEQAYEDFLRGGHDSLSWPNLDKFFYDWYRTKYHENPDVKKVIFKTIPGDHYAEELYRHVTGEKY